MAWKSIRILMILIMDLVILILIEVQAIDMPSTYFHPSSLPISLHHPFKLDRVYISFPICFESKIKQCKKLSEKEDLFGHSLCVLNAFQHCVWKMDPSDSMHEVSTTIKLLCLKEYRQHIQKNNEETTEPTTFYNFGECLVQQYKGHFRKH